MGRHRIDDQRGGVRVGELRIERHHGPGIGQSVLRPDAAAAPRHRDGDALSDQRPRGLVVAGGDDLAHALEAGCDALAAGLAVFALDVVEVRRIDVGEPHPDQHLAALRLRHGHLQQRAPVRQAGDRRPLGGAGIAVMAQDEGFHVGGNGGHRRAFLHKLARTARRGQARRRLRAKHRHADPVACGGARVPAGGMGPALRSSSGLCRWLARGEPCADRGFVVSRRCAGHDCNRESRSSTHAPNSCHRGG